jgi:hypothetical protein
LCYIFAKIKSIRAKMEKQIESSNSIGATSRDFLLPGWSQFFLYFLISFLLLIALNIRKAWDYLNQTVLKPEGGLDSIVASKTPGVHKVINSLSQSILLQVVFWVFVGCVVYVIVWIIKNIAINLLNDITADLYVHPASYKRYKFWGSILARRIFFFLSAAMLVIFLTVGGKTLIYLASLSYNAVVYFTAAQSTIDIAESLIATTCLIYIGVLLVHIVMSSWRIMYKDL